MFILNEKSTSVDKVLFTFGSLSFSFSSVQIHKIHKMDGLIINAFKTLTICKVVNNSSIFFFCSFLINIFGSLLFHAQRKNFFPSTQTIFKDISTLYYQVLTNLSTCMPYMYVYENGKEKKIT